MSDDTTSPTPEDKVTFGSTAANKQVLDDLVRQGYFKTQLGAFQASAMLALRRGLTPSATPMATPSGGTTWNRGSVPREVLDFLEWYLPTKTPARALEQLGNLGTALIEDRVKSTGYTYSELFDLPRDLASDV